MNRRQVLTASIPLVTAATAGCLDTPPNDPVTDETGTSTDTEQTAPENGNPWGKDSVVVGVEQEVDARHDFHEIVQEGLRYWEENSEVYAGYSIAYEYRPNADNPDIQITLVNEITECGDHEEGTVVGCAPLITHRAPETADIQIEDGFDADYTLQILKHELGHTLGLNHGDEPRQIMSDDIEDRIPEYRQRESIIESYSDAFDDINEANTHLENAMDYFDNEQWASAEAEAIRAHDAYENANERIDSARTIAEEIDEPDAVGICDIAYDNIEHTRKLSDAFAKAARAIDRDDRDEFETQRDRIEFHESQMAWDAIEEPVELARSLGIPIQD